MRPGRRDTVGETLFWAVNRIERKPLFARREDAALIRNLYLAIDACADALCTCGSDNHAVDCRWQKVRVREISATGYV